MIDTLSASFNFSLLKSCMTGFFHSTKSLYFGGTCLPPLKPILPPYNLRFANPVVNGAPNLPLAIFICVPPIPNIESGPPPYDNNSVGNFET